MVGVYQKACPELVEIVEAGQADSPRAEAALRRDLAEVVGLGPDVLVLGCTHYPLLTPAIERVFPRAFAIVDSARTTAAVVERRLDHARMRAQPDGSAPRHELLVTAVPEQFNQVAEVLFRERVPEVGEVRLWPSSPPAEPGIIGGRVQASRATST
jgi:glutamate racemase